MSIIHDNEIISYEVNLKNEVINIHTLSESGQKITLFFSGVLAHMFETHLSGSIIFDIEKTELRHFFVENRDLIEKQKDYCWPIDYTDIQELEDKLVKHQYSYYVISASFGLNGWILAKKYEISSPY
ncbi:hypothetical protein [Bacillus solitudinis]|uniref:hypothetical protein n=1 Tax=Bacillus solitudinis TaxID=2014074 RepID=UPI000C2324AC|nr:hypothetical protein [Bacillus solitudinis]